MHVNWMLSFGSLAKMMQKSMFEPFVKQLGVAKASVLASKTRRDRVWARRLAESEEKVYADEAAEKAEQLLKAGFSVPKEAKN